MIVSPSASAGASSETIESTSPAGTISQTDRGASSCSASSASEDAVDSTFGSNVCTSCPAARSRSVMLPPIRPRPTIPSCTTGPPIRRARHGDRARELPAEELLPELVRILEPHLATLAIGPVGRLAGRRHEALVVLSGRLRDQLLGPKAEAAVRLVDADLVATFAPSLAELLPELEPGVALGKPARLGHLERALEQPLEVDPKQRRRNEAERRQRRVAAADGRLAVEDV